MTEAREPKFASPIPGAHPRCDGSSGQPAAVKIRSRRIFQWGQRVRAGIDLYNDGSHPGHAPDALLVPAGAIGEIVQTGMHVESNTPVYMVEFDGVQHVVGCLQEEITPD